MAKKQSTAKKPIKVSPPAKKLLEEVASTSKKHPPPESPPSDYEEMESEEDVTHSSSEEEEEEEEPDSGKNPQSPSAPAPIQSSDQESETESGESDAETEPASTKPPLLPPAPVASPRTLRKRTASPDSNGTTTKRAKAEIETGTAKKASSQRVWSEEDEIALLQCLVEFKDETGKNPSEDVSGFYKLVKDGINFKGKSFSQFTSKVIKLKSKYLGKSKSLVIYTKPHDLKCLDLCKKIWVTDLVSSDVVKSEKKKKRKVEDDSVKLGDGVKGDSDWFERSYLVGAMMYLGVVDDESVKKKWSLVPVEIKKKLEDKFKLMQADDFKRLTLKTQLLHEVSSAIANA